jgi:hypothetical protein
MAFLTFVLIGGSIGIFIFAIYLFAAVLNSVTQIPETDLTTKK